jgi:phosphoglycerol transferase
MGAWFAFWHAFGWFLFAHLRWLVQSFGKTSVDQILYHLTFESQGVFQADFKIIRGYLIQAVAFPVFGMFMMALILRKLNQSKPEGVRKWAASVPLTLFLLSAILAESGIGVSRYLSAIRGKDYIAEHYLKPTRFEKRTTRGKNLVLIYAEGMDASYASKSLFGRNLIESLTGLGGESFSDFRQAPGTEWTMAGIVASQCGLPLKAVTVGDMNEQMGSIKSFLPRATCLGDTLKGFGYRNVFLGGASLKFAGKGNFFMSHGYEKAFGKEEWLLTGRYRDSDLNEWGLGDDDLFKEARSQVDSLAASGAPFHLTILTVNTHPPEGFSTRKCKSAGKNTFEDRITCSANEIASVVTYLGERGYLENTNVVILGDHLSMTNPLSDRLSQVPRRTIFNRWIAREGVRKNQETLVHFDFAASILDFIGIHPESGRYGLGYSAFSPSNPSESEWRLTELQENVLNRSPFYSDLWKPVNKPF